MKPYLISDLPIRLAAFEWLNHQKLLYGESLSYTLLQKGFEFKGNQIHLVGASGIWKPKACELPISILTAKDSGYDDAEDENGIISYSYRGKDPNHRDNVGLKLLMEKQIPLIYFWGLGYSGRYLPIYPIYIQSNNPSQLKVSLQLDERIQTSILEVSDSKRDPVREYMTVEVKKRMHQEEFRDNVLSVYGCQCALCKIRHLPLLDAAHIVPDKHELGLPKITNGLSLCKIHHAAYDANLMGISPDYKIHVKLDLLEEIDGPMLQHGIKELHQAPIQLPKNKIHHPSKNNLSIRFEEFLKAG